MFGQFTVRSSILLTVPGAPGTDIVCSNPLPALQVTRNEVAGKGTKMKVVEKMKRAYSYIAVGSAILSATALMGCSSNDVSTNAILGNLTPELQGLNERPVDIRSHMAVTGNVELREMWGDLGRAIYIDHPSRLSPYPIVYTSGQPR